MVDNSGVGCVKMSALTPQDSASLGASRRNTLVPTLGKELSPLNRAWIIQECW